MTDTVFFHRGQRVRHEDGDVGTVVEADDLNVVVDFNGIDSSFSRHDSGIFDPPSGRPGVSYLTPLRHSPECVKIIQNSRYNPHGTRGCELCDDKAARVPASCPTDPYDPFCEARSCACGRPGDTS